MTTKLIDVMIDDDVYPGRISIHDNECHCQEIYLDNQWKLHSIDGDYSYYLGDARLWHWKGNIHRVGAPAAISDDGWGYYQNNLLHRLDGPASFMFGVHTWYIMGNKIHHDILLEMGIENPMKIDPLDQELLRLKFC